MPSFAKATEGKIRVVTLLMEANLYTHLFFSFLYFLLAAKESTKEKPPKNPTGWTLLPANPTPHGAQSHPVRSFAFGELALPTFCIKQNCSSLGFGGCHRTHCNLICCLYYFILFFKLNSFDPMQESDSGSAQANRKWRELAAFFVARQSKGCL